MISRIFIASTVLTISLAPALADDDATPKKAAAVIEFRRAETEAGEGLEKVEVDGSVLYLRKAADVDGSGIEAARVATDARGEPSIEITFTREAAKTMQTVSKQHMGKPLAVVFKGRVLVAPTIRATLSDRVVITGQFTHREATEISDAIQDAAKVRSPER